MDYVTPQKMRELEMDAVAGGVTVKRLMENAGGEVAKVVVSRFGDAKRVCVVCGGGNNGGDGLVAARHLAPRFEVAVVLLTAPEEIRTQEARENWAALEGTGVERHVAPELTELLACSKLISRAQVVIAAIIGTGVRGGEVEEPYATAISLVNAAWGARVAVDLPSGLDPETGVPARPTVRADLTVALHLPKVGLRGNEAFSGEVVVVPIGMGTEKERGGS